VGTSALPLHCSCTGYSDKAEHPPVTPRQGSSDSVTASDSACETYSDKAATPLTCRSWTGTGTGTCDSVTVHVRPTVTEQQPRSPAAPMARGCIRALVLPLPRGALRICPCPCPYCDIRTYYGACYGACCGACPGAWRLAPAPSAAAGPCFCVRQVAACSSYCRGSGVQRRYPALVCGKWQPCPLTRGSGVPKRYPF